MLSNFIPKGMFRFRSCVHTVCSVWALPANYIFLHYLCFDFLLNRENIFLFFHLISYFSTPFRSNFHFIYTFVLLILSVNRIHCFTEILFYFDNSVKNLLYWNEILSIMKTMTEQPVLWELKEPKAGFGLITNLSASSVSRNSFSLSGSLNKWETFSMILRSHENACIITNVTKMNA